jgi:hypothetical protein
LKLFHKALPADDPRQRQPDIDLAISQPGWKPTVRLDEELTRKIDYFEQLLKSDNQVVLINPGVPTERHRVNEATAPRS